MDKSKKRSQPPALKHPNLLLKALLGLLSPTGVLCSSIAFFLCLVGAYYAFSPKLSITPAQAINSDDLLTSRFEIRNEGVLNVNSLSLLCQITRVESDRNAVLINGYLSDGAAAVKRLFPGETTTYSLPINKIFKLPGSIAYSDIVVIIKYKPAFFPFEMRASQRFKTERLSTGALHWYKISLSE